MRPPTAEAMPPSPLSLYPDMQFHGGWAGQGLVPAMGAAAAQPGAIPAHRDVPLSTRWGNGRLPVLRGWVVLAGAMAPAPAEDLPAWTVAWPCRLADLEARLREVSACEEAARQDWFDQGVDACGVAPAHALEHQARVVAWLLDRESALELGWTGGAGRAGHAVGADVELEHDHGLQQLIAAMAELVPGAVFRLDGGAGQAAEAARCIVADLLALEQTGRTHGMCLARMRRNVLSKRGLPLNAASADRPGVAL